VSTLQDAIEAIQDKTLALDGMRAAPDYPPEDQSAYPFSLAYADRGGWETMGGQDGRKIAYATIIVEIHCSRAPGLPRSVQQAMPYHERFADALLSDIDLNETVDQIGHGKGEPPIRWTFGALGYGTTRIVPTIGYRFEVDIKQSSAISS